MNRLKKITQVFVLLTVLASLIGPGAIPVNADPPRVQPVIANIAAQMPEQTLSVIVQKTLADRSLEELVIQLGGEVTSDLHIINAFAAELPARAVAELSLAPGVRWVSLDAPVFDAGVSAKPGKDPKKDDDPKGGGPKGGGPKDGDPKDGGPKKGKSAKKNRVPSENEKCKDCIDTNNLTNTYIYTIGADQVWNEEPFLQGEGIAVAVVDSGVNKHKDLEIKRKTYREIDSINYTKDKEDKFGHGTHIAGIIAGSGKASKGSYIGVAPEVSLLDVQISDRAGVGNISDVIAGLQWVLDHKEEYNIRVVNLALNSTVPESYHVSPLSAAVEILWFNGIVVVVSAGNNGGGDANGILYPPANDPFVITVGAMDDLGTVDTTDDVLASFSAYGTTQEGYFKPELAAPGRNIVSLTAGDKAEIYKNHKDNRIGRDYFRMSGTSMSSAVVSGAVALLLEDEPNLTPDQVKYRLMATAQDIDHPGAGAGSLDIYAAVHAATTESANTGIETSQLLWTGDEAITWNSVAWNSVAWNSVAWNSVAWNSVAWNSVAWNSVSWED